MSRLRVVHVITTLTTGGAERQVELIAGASRHDVSVVCLYSGGVVEDALVARGIPVQTLGMDGWLKLTAIPRLALLLRRLSPDVVHVHLLSGQLWGVPAARLAGVRTVVSTEHSIMETTIEGRPKTELLRRLYLVLERMTTHTVAVSAATVRRLRAWGVRRPDRMTVINPPIDFGAMATDGPAHDEVRRELGIPDDATVIGSIGRLDPVKRHEQLITSLAERLRGGDHLVIVGDGSRREQLVTLIDDLGLADRVHLTGPRGDVPRLLAAFDLFVSPSRDETFGMAVVEAIGAGLPVVYAQCPALDDLDLDADRIRRIDDDSGADDETADLLAAVAAVAGLGRAPVPPALLERYGTEHTAARIDELYDRLVGDLQRSRS